MKSSEINYSTNFNYVDLVNFLKFYLTKSDKETLETYEDELADFLSNNSISRDGGRFKAIDMIDMLRHYDERVGHLGTDTFEQDVDEFIECSKELNLGSNRINVSLTKEDIVNIKDSIETKLAAMDYDDVENSNYESKTDFEHALYMILDKFTHLNK